MRIALVQLQCRAGQVLHNRSRHLDILQKAASLKADFMLFPELSLTGYEPTLVNQLAMLPDDPLLEPFSVLSRQHNLSFGIGCPLRVKGGIAIGMMLFVPSGRRTVYTKQYLHPDEEPYFVAECTVPLLPSPLDAIGLAICYEISIPRHALAHHQDGKGIYLASVAKSKEGMAIARPRMQEIATQYHQITGIANSVGPNDDFIGWGGTTWWDAHGTHLGTIGETTEGVLLLDTGYMIVESYLV